MGGATCPEIFSPSLKLRALLVELLFEFRTQSPNDVLSAKSASGGALPKGKTVILSNLQFCAEVGLFVVISLVQTCPMFFVAKVQR